MLGQLIIDRPKSLLISDKAYGGIQKLFHLRPIALNRYDQVYMSLDSMFLHSTLIYPYFNGESCVFIGDAEGVSVCLAYLSSEHIIKGPKKYIIFDFVERILDWISKSARICGVEDYFETILYNVIDPLPPKYMCLGTRFHTNPPYGSVNNGFSPILFFHRALEATCFESIGCIILPLDYYKKWTHNVIFEFQKTCLSYGCLISESIHYLHHYYGAYDPDIKSGIMFAWRVSKKELPFTNKRVPNNLLKYFYGELDIKIPRYIRISKDKTDYLEDSKIQANAIKPILIL